MSDALCGPSNPLQQFQKSTQLDRTLQQDRLTSRSSPVQGFRSPDQNAGILDPEFEAFQAGLPAPDLPQYQPFQHYGPEFAQPNQVPGWASDFQRMHISSPPPLQQQYQPAPSTDDWTQGFQKHLAQQAPRAQNSSPSPWGFQNRARYGNGMNGGYMGSMAAPGFAPNVLQSKGKEPAMQEFDDAAFEQAFDQARQGMMAEPRSQHEDEDMASTEQHLKEMADALSTPAEPASKLDQYHGYARDQMEFNINIEQSAGNESLMQERQDLADDTAALHDLDQHDQNATVPIERLMNHQMLREAQEFEDAQRSLGREPEEQEIVDEQQLKEDHDALAKTAHELLEKIEHNKTAKFKNSQFLGLMRKLRDREVHVEGDKMVETGVSTPTPRERPLSFDFPRPLREPLDPSQNGYESPGSPPWQPGHLHAGPAEHITCKVFGCSAYQHELEHTLHD